MDCIEDYHQYLHYALELLSQHFVYEICET